MAERRWTKEQLSAIEERNKTLLVSAAAGSGKTATLTERIIRSLLDKENPTTIDSLLVVTFTNAAASELREKIRKALENAIKENPGDEQLTRQLMLLPSAKIKTIDAFCNDLLKSNATFAGLNPKYRISVGAECSILSSSIMEGLIDSIYAGDEPQITTPEEFEALAECLTNAKRTEKLADVLMYIYEKTETSIDGIDTISNLCEIFNPDKFTTVDETAHGKYINEKYTLKISHYINVFEKFRRLLDPDHPNEQGYLATLNGDLDLLHRLLNASSYNERSAAILSFSLKAISRSKGEKTQTMVDFHETRNKMRDDIKSSAKLFLYSEEDWKNLYSSLYAIFTTLCKVLFTFDRIFSEEKRQRGIVTYADIERYAYNCLWKDGEKTSLAHSLSKAYSQIYIDEYQDVNALQDKIFEAIAKPDNRFMVGDIKQSIYSFRSARPEIFAKMKSTFPLLSESTGDEATIFMSSNFRCDKGIIDFTNAVFDKMFGLLGESIGYRNEDRLLYAKIQSPEPPYRKPSVVICESATYCPDSISMADTVVAKIKQLLESGRLNDGTPIKPSDIVLIFRKNTLLKDYASILAENSIPIEISTTEKFFITPEILLTLSFLHSIDNPHRDIYLAALMCSPLFGFDGTDIATIKLRFPAETLYDSVCLAAASGDFPNAESFLKTLNYYRTVSEGTTVDKLIYKIYHETGLLSLASKNNGRQNLMFLYDHARSFESGTFKGLYNFITYIDNVLADEKTDEFEERRASGESNAVTLITAHKSKGLEYPIVFFITPNKPIVKKGSKPDSEDKWVKYSEDFGISLFLRTPSGLARVNNPVNYAIDEFEEEKTFDEELRALYVILTRARERLYVIGESPKKDIDEYKNHIRLLSENLTPYSARELSTFTDVILASVGGGISPEDFLRKVDPSDTLTEKEQREASSAENENLHAENKSSHGGSGEIKTQNANALFGIGNIEAQSADRLVQNVLALDENESTKFPAASEGTENSTASEGTEAQNADEKMKKTELVKLLKERFEYQYRDRFLTSLPEKMSVSSLSPDVLDGADDNTFQLFSAPDEQEKTPEDEEKDEKVTLPKFMSGSNAEESAKCGIATHYFMQFCDLEAFFEKGSEAELKRLVDKGFISKKDGERVRIDELEAFRKSKLLSKMMGAKELYRELRFNIYLPAKHFTEDEQRIEAYEGEKVLVQGVIDCIYKDEKGKLHLVDYKTDRLTYAERKNKALAEEKMKKAHSLQLSYYALAVKEIFGAAPSDIAVYSLHFGDEIKIDNILEK